MHIIAFTQDQATKVAHSDNKDFFKLDKFILIPKTLYIYIYIYIIKRKKASFIRNH